MDTKKDEFLNNIVNVSYYGHALEDLLNTAADAHFTYTLKGAIKNNEAKNSSAGGAYWWMYCHYDSVAAAIKAAACLAESLNRMAEDLYSAARDLVPDVPQKVG